MTDEAIRPFKLMKDQRRGRLPGCGLLAFGVVMCAFRAALAEPVRIEVAPGEGTLENAFADLRRLVRENGGVPPKGGVVLELADGRYPLRKTLELGEKESGRGNAPIVVRAKNRGKAVVSGARTLGPWKVVDDPEVLARLPEASRGKVLECTVSGEGPLPGFRGGGCIRRRELTETCVQLYQRDRRLPCARWPKKSQTFTGFPLGPVIPALKTCCGRMYDGGIFRYRSPRLASWANEKDLWAAGQWFYEWSNTVTPVEKIDVESETITVDMLQNGFGVKYGAGFNVLNAVCEMSEPGDWTVDRSARRIRLLPVADVVAHPVTMPCVNELVHARGWHDARVEGVVFEDSLGDGLVFADTVDVTVSASCVRHMGQVGVRIVRAYRTRMLGCDVYDIGGTAISLDGGDRLKLIRGDCLVENCDIHDFGVVVPNYSPGVGLNGCGNRATRNLIHDSVSNAILFGGNDHDISYNVIHDVCRSCDAGAIYCSTRDWTQRGTVVEYNLVHMSGKQPRCSHTNGIYFDDFSAGLVMRGNLINRCSMGIYLGGGSQNLVEKNLVMNAPTSFVLGTRDPTSWCAREWIKDGTNGLLYVSFERHRDVFTNATWTARYPDLMRNLSFADPKFPYNALWNVIRDNVATGVLTEFRMENEKVIAPYTTMTNNVIAKGDPGFVDYGRFDWRLREDSPYYKLLGDTRVDRMGLYDSPDRFSPARKFAPTVTPPRPIGPEKVLADMNINVIPEGVDWRKDRELVRFDGFRGCEPPDGSKGHALVGHYGPANRSDEDWRLYEFEFTPLFDGRALVTYCGGPGEKTDVRNVSMTGVEGFDPVRFPAKVGGGKSVLLRVTLKKGMRVTGRFEARAAELADGSK